MYQFRREDMALEAARLLAVYERQPIAVMARGLMDFFTIGPIDSAVVHEAGRHMATVYRSGHVQHMGLAGKQEPAELTGYRASVVLVHALFENLVPCQN
jgi:hypothetical protein